MILKRLSNVRKIKITSPFKNFFSSAQKMKSLIYNLDYLKEDSKLYSSIKIGTYVSQIYSH